MKLKEFPNKLGYDLTHNGRKYEVWRPYVLSGDVFTVHTRNRYGEVTKTGKGETVLGAIANMEKVKAND